MPSTTVAVPLLLAVDVLLDFVEAEPVLDAVLELDELPQAASTSAASTALATHSGRLYFLMRPPPRGLS
ncbi:MAG TPA: hypothetical protein VIH85_13795, partial [Solirubrobacteraceae bacterium]